MPLTRPRAYQISNLDFKQSTRVTTSSDITLDGGAPSSVDGVTLSSGDRVLVSNQTDKSENGIYEVETAGTGSNGTWTRASDFDVHSGISAGIIVMVTEGVNNSDTQWKLVTDDPITVGTTDLDFELIEGSTSSSFSTITVGQTDVTADTTTDTLELISGNNVTLGANANSKTVTVSVNSFDGTITGNLIPDSNETYDLGSDSFRFNDIYLSGNTINVGNSKISSDAGNIQITDSQNNLGRIIANEIEVGSGSQRIKISRNSNGKIKFDSFDSESGITENIDVVDWDDITNKPDPTISLSGDLSGSATLANVGNATINATLSDNLTLGNIVVDGNLTVNGSQTILDTNIIKVEDKSIELGNTSSPNNSTASDGGIILLAGNDGDKSILWQSSSSSWTFSDSIDLGNNDLKIAGNTIISNSGEWLGLDTGSSVTISETPPSSPSNGDLWWDSSESNLYIYYEDGDSNQWVSATAVADGADGTDGTDGEGVPAGGSSGQVLAKSSATDYDTGWVDISSSEANATDDTSSSTLYPIMVGGTGSDEVIKASKSNLEFDASNGTLSVTSLTETSSRRYKKNIQNISNALNVVCEMQGVTFDRKDDSSTNESGLIAEELHKIVPSLVALDDEGNPKSVHYTRIIAYLIESIKEQQKQIDELRK